MYPLFPWSDRASSPDFSPWKGTSPRQGRKGASPRLGRSEYGSAMPPGARAQRAERTVSVEI